VLHHPSANTSEYKIGKGDNVPHDMRGVELDVKDVTVVRVPELADHGASADIPHLDRLVVAPADEASSAWVE